MYFDFSIPRISLLLLCIAALLGMVALSYTVVQSRRVARCRRRSEALPTVDDNDFEPVSVIIYSQDEAEALEVLLRDVLSQDYPAPMEVIVVNEGDNPAVRDTVSSMQLAHRNLYLTHTPDGARNLSRKKLALTLGVKAARHGVVVHTAVGAAIPGPRWLRCMMRRFRADSPVEVVLGYAAPPADADSARGARCRAFDYAAAATRWIGAAASGRPFRGTELNIAYRRDTFFRNKGFSRSLNLHFGDDDIFVSEIARADNTAVELSEASRVGMLSHDYGYSQRRLALRHAFTERHIHRRPRLWATVSGLAAPCAVAAATAAAVADMHNALTVSLAVVLVLLLGLGLTLGWRRAMRALGSRRLCLSIVPLALTRPLRRAMMQIRERLGKHKRYTWD